MKQLQTLSFGANMQITESLKHEMSHARLPAGDSVFNPLDTPPVDPWPVQGSKQSFGVDVNYEPGRRPVERHTQNKTILSLDVGYSVVLNDTESPFWKRNKC